MTINSDKNSTQIEKLIYDQPSLTKYGTMKSITQNGAGSAGATYGGSGDAPANQDPIQMDDNNDALT